jgi:translocation and assembly module TamB
VVDELAFRQSNSNGIDPERLARRNAMTEPGAPKRRRRLWKFLLLTVVAGLVALAGLAWYLTTDSFQAMMRRRLVAELEHISGGRVELGSIHTIPFRLQVDVRDLTIHGREASTDVPLAHVDRLVTRMTIISTLGAEIGFHSLVLDHPVIHLIAYPDGTTNLPSPRLRASQIAQVEQLFALSIRRLEVNHGEFLWNDQTIPIDFKAADVTAEADYSVFHRRYDAHLTVGKIDTKYGDYRPVAWKGEAHFALMADALEIKSVTASSGHSHAEASGRITNLRQPQFLGQYGLSVDLAEAAPILRVPQLRRGILQVNGQGSWAGPVFSSTGKLSLNQLEWRDNSMVLRTSSLNTHFNLDSRRLMLSAIQGNAFGGNLSGDAEITNWLNPAPANKRGKSADEQVAAVRVKIRDISVGELSTNFSSLRPLLELNLAGSATGTVETHWRGSARNAESTIAFDVAPPSQSPAGQLSTRAHARVIYRQPAGDIEVSEFNAGTRATQFRASGTLSQHAALKVSVNSSDLEEWDRVMSLVGFQQRYPVTMHGSASFNGTATGRFSDLSLAGKIQAENFEIEIPAHAHATKERVRGDFLSADIQISPYSFTAHHGMWRNGATTLSFSANAGLESWEFLSASPFSAHLTTQSADVREAMAIADLHYPVSGKLNFSVDIGGTQKQPGGHGSLRLFDAMIAGKAVRELDSMVSLLESRVSLQDIRVIYQDAEVTGSGGYDLSTNAYSLDLHGHNFDLAGIPTLQTGPLPIEGRVDFDAKSSGTPQAPVINAKIRLRNLVVGNELVGDYVFEAMTQGADLQLDGRSQFKQAELNIDGNVHLRQQWLADLDLHFNHLDVDPLLRIYLGKYVTGHSEAAGEVQLRGPLLNPRELQVTANVSDLFADLEHVQIRNNGPIRFVFADQSLTVQQLHLVGGGTDLAVAGTAKIGGDQQLALHADGNADLKLLHSFDSDFTSSGPVAVNVGLAGTISHPAWQGTLQVSGGSIQYSDLPSALSDIKGRLIFNQNRLQVETLTARVGGGVISFGGYATAYQRQLNFDLTLGGKDVRLRYPQGVSSMTDAQMRWTGTSAASTISGDVTVTRLAVTPGFDFGSYLTSSAQTVALPQNNPLLSRISLDLHIVTTPELQMQTAALRLSGNADFRLRGTASKPVLLGRADVIEGEVYFNGAKYRLERGDITFTNPVTTTPFLDLQASTRVREYDITLTLNGQIDKLKLNYRSEPPLPQTDIISLMAVGQTQEQNAQLQQSGQSPYVAQASSAMLADAINSALSNRSQRLFGISHIKVDPQGLNTETSPVQPTPLPAVTIEQQVRDNITLTYTTNVAQTSQQIIQGIYNITSDVMIVGIRDYNGVVSFELRLRQRKR